MDSDFKNFIAWMQSQGCYISPKVSIENNTKYNHYAIASEDIEEEEILFKVPRTMVLSFHNSEICDILMKEKVIHNSRWASLVLCIFHELFLKEKSRWFQYLKNYPNFDNHTLPLLWSNNEMEILQGTGIEDSVRNEIDWVENEYKLYVEPFITKYPELFEKGINLNKYKYYIGFVKVYSFFKSEVEDDNYVGIEGEDVDTFYFVPVIDTLSHASKNNTKLKCTPSEIMMISKKPILLGTEININYGAFPNTLLLFDYGFTLPYEENDAEFIEIDIYGVQRFQYSTEILEKLDIMKDFRKLTLSKNGFLNPKTLATMLYILHLNKDKLDEDGRPEMVSSNILLEEQNMELDLMADYLNNLKTIEKVPPSWRSFLEICINETIRVKHTALNNLKEKTLKDEEFNPILYVKGLLLSHLNLLKNALAYL